MANSITRDHHLLTRNLKLNGNYISNDGGDEGISITDAGLVTVSGDLDIASNMTISDNEIDISSGDLHLDVAGDINLDPASLINFNKAGTNIGFLGVTGAYTNLRLIGAGGAVAASYFDFRVLADGATTLLTNDDDGTGADLTVSVNGKMTFTSDLATEFITSNGKDITFTSADDIILDANGESVLMKGSVGTLEFVNNGSGAYTIRNLTSNKDIFFYVNDGGVDTEVMRLDASVSALLMQPNKKIYFGNAGEYIAGDGTHLAITSSGNLSLTSTATLNLLSDDNIIIDAADTLTIDTDGTFIMMQDGAEFSVANSAWAGMILGYTMIGEDSAEGYVALATSFATLHNYLTVRFEAPPSGAVEVTVQTFINTSSNTEIVEFSLSTTNTSAYTPLEHAGVGTGTTYEQIVFQADRSDDSVIQHSWVVTGLTAGDTYNYWLAAEATAGSTRLYWGGTATSESPDFIMKVTALPTAVANYAVYN